MLLIDTLCFTVSTCLLKENPAQSSVAVLIYISALLIYFLAKQFSKNCSLAYYVPDHLNIQYII